MATRTRWLLAALTVIPWSMTALAQGGVAPGDAPTYRPAMSFHGTSQRLDVLAQRPTPVPPGGGQRIEPEMERLYEEPTPAIEAPPPFVQTSAPTPAAAVAGASFEGPGTGLAGFTMTGAPPDMTMAVGPNHIVAWVNSQYAVFNKTGTLLLAPVNGNTLFTGLGNECATTNRGDPIVQYDRLANRWVLSQFAFATSGGAPVSPYFQCIAVSTSGDPTGTYVRYSVLFSGVSPSGFNDYGKIGIWPDAYYTSYNIFGGSPAGGNTGVALCASDRTKMLVGDSTATTLCAPINFYAGGAAFLPADMDGTTLPTDQAQGGIFMRFSSAPALRVVKLKPNFAAGTVTLTNGFGGALGTFVNLPLPATTIACNGSSGACVPQPGTVNMLDTLADRLMYRLAFRNRAGVESLLVNHSVDPDGPGARDATLRWYEIRNPLGNPADPVVANRPVIFQNGTYDPDTSSDRWMGSIAMDQFGNIMMGYSLANAGAGRKPSIGIAGREPGDPVNTLQAEIVALTGTGSQTGTLTRWGDYSTIQVDPLDDRTFWFIGEYLSADGSFNWRTRVVSYAFPAPASLSINDVAVTEGNSGSSNATFTITRSSNIAAVSVQVDTTNGTATAGSDYTAVSGQVVNFTAGGSLTATVSVPVTGDNTLEANETYTVNLSNAVNASIADASGLGTINNDDAATIAINDVTLAEGNTGNTAFTFTVTLASAVQGGFTVPFNTANGTATQPGDYASNSGTLTFAGTAGETQTVTVQVAGETTLEGNETFTVALGTPSVAGVTASDGSGLGTINNDDAATIAINDVTLAEGNAGNTAFVFTVTLTGAVQGGFTVPFNTANGTAAQPGDYTSNTGTLTFTGTAAETRTLTVQVAGDAIVEANETFTVVLGTPSVAGVSASDASGLGTINNDDAATIAINDVTLAEGNTGNTAFVFTVTLTGTVQGGFTVPFNTANGTATQPGDYASSSGTLTFAGTTGETQTVTVQVAGEAIVEGNETFTVALGTPSVAGVTAFDASGLGTINNDDAATIAINDVTLAEGNTGNTAFVFTVTLTGTVQGGFTVPFNTANGTAIQPGDYATNSGTLTFAGTTGETRTVTVQVVGETLVEGIETFTVALGAPSVVGVTASDGSGLGTINNDDAATIAINDVTLAEGNTGNTAFVFTVTLTGAVQGGFTVPFASANGTAIQPGDYASSSGTLTFAGTAGETQTVTVQVVGDALVESNETFGVGLGTPSVASVTASDGSGLGTINNDDAATIAINDVTLAEGNAGNTAFVFTVTLTGAVQGGFTVPFATANGTATQPSDYASNSGTLTFAGTMGEAQTVTVQVAGDAIVEGNESFTVALGTPSVAGVTASDGSGLGTINNDDAATISINDVTLAEGNTGSTPFVFTVTLTGTVQGGFTVPFATANGTAIQPGDFASNSGTLTFTGTAGETRTISVAVVGELIPEPDETFTVALGTPSVAGVTASDASGLGTINNDDLSADISVSVSDGVTVIAEGGRTSYTVTIANPSVLIDVATLDITQTSSTGLTMLSWTCVATGTAGCPATGTGAITQTLALPRSSTLTFLVSASVALGAPSPVLTTVSAVVQPPQMDPNPANNSATDSDAVLPFALFGDSFE